MSISPGECAWNGDRSNPFGYCQRRSSYTVFVANCHCRNRSGNGICSGHELCVEHAALLRRPGYRNPYNGQPVVILRIAGAVTVPDARGRAS